MIATPTPYPEINDVLARILANAKTTLGAKLVGMYQYGSLASGDFDPASSDVDFLAVTAGPLSDGEVEALRRFHAELLTVGGEWARRLEGGYVTAVWLRRDDPADTSRFPFLTEDTPFGVYQMGWDWVINRYVLREHGVILHGPPPAALIDPISPEQLKKGVRDVLRHEWAKYAAGSDVPLSFHERRYQAFIVLTMCRALYVLDRGKFVTKPVAGAWAEQHVAQIWVPLIKWALAMRHDSIPDDAMLPATLDFVRFTLSRAES